MGYRLSHASGWVWDPELWQDHPAWAAGSGPIPWQSDLLNTSPGLQLSADTRVGISHSPDAPVPASPTCSQGPLTPLFAVSVLPSISLDVPRATWMPDLTLVDPLKMGRAPFHCYQPHDPHHWWTVLPIMKLMILWFTSAHSSPLTWDRGRVHLLFSCFSSLIFLQESSASFKSFSHVHRG